MTTRIHGPSPVYAGFLFGRHSGSRFYGGVRNIRVTRFSVSLFVGFVGGRFVFERNVDPRVEIEVVRLKLVDRKIGRPI